MLKACTDCPYNHKIQVKYEGQKTAPVMVLGESPGGEEEKVKRPFQGRSGQLLNAILQLSGLKRNGMFIANASRCRLTKENKRLESEVLKHCREHLVKAISIIKPKLIITLGEIALKQLSKKQKMKDVRGRFWDLDEFSCKVFSTMHPAYVLRGATKDYPNKPYELMSMRERSFVNDFKTISDYISMDFKEDSIDVSGYREGTLKELAQIKKAGVVSIDYETTGVRAIDPAVKALSVSFTIKEGQSRVYLLNKKTPKAVLSGIGEIIVNPDSKKIVVARPFEDLVSKYKLGVELKGQVFDVLTMAHIMDENHHVYNLESVTNTYAPALRNIKDLSDGMRSDLINASKETLITYNGGDTDAALRVFNILKGKYNQDKKLLRYYLKFMQPIQNMYADIVRNGVLIDQAVLKDNEQELISLSDSLHAEALACIPFKIRDKYGDDVKLSRAVIIQDYLFKSKYGLKIKPVYFTEKTKEPATSEDHIKLFSGRYPFIDLYLRWKKANKILTSYFENLWGDIYPDGRIYPSTIMTRTVTGRVILKNPAIQTYPKRGEFSRYIREAIVADNGWYIGARDLAQSEFRIIGWVAQDPNILGALRAGIDLHTKTASVINNIHPENVTPEQRDKSKPAGFGFIYGLSARGFRYYAKDEFGIDFTEKECEDLRAGFFSNPKGYYKLPIYYEKIKFLGRKQGYVESALGRRRRLPAITSQDYSERSEAERQAINSPIQGLSSDLGLLGKYMAWQEIKKSRLESKIKLTWFIHDNIMFHVKEDYLEKGMALIKDCMENRAKEYIHKNFGVLLDYPIESDAKYGKSWGKMGKFKE